MWARYGSVQQIVHAAEVAARRGLAGLAAVRESHNDRPTNLSRKGLLPVELGFVEAQLGLYRVSVSEVLDEAEAAGDASDRVLDQVAALKLAVLAEGPLKLGLSDRLSKLTNEEHRL